MNTDLVTLRGDEFELFIPLSKINEKTREFEAWATLEEIDASNEIIDIDKSFPYFEALAARMSKASDGQNFGPIREQHDPNKASGHLIAPPEIRTHDSGARGIYINGVLTDDQTYAKMVKKTLTGVSIGGKYVGEPEMVKVGDRNAKKFIANPNHYGVVDAPCVKNALVTVVKMDGSEVIEKVVGYDPPQGFLCRGEEFHERKGDARNCTEHLAKSDGGTTDADSPTGKANAASEKANGYSYAAPDGKDTAEYHRKAQAAHTDAAAAHRTAQNESKDAGDNAQARHHGKAAEKHDDAASAHGAIAAAHEAATKSVAGGDLQKADATECACCKKGGCDCDSRDAEENTCSCHADCSGCDDKDCEGLAAEKAETGGAMQKVAERTDVSAADKKRAAGEASNFADEKNKKYKLDTAPQVKAAWSYINMPKNAAKYSAADVKTIKAKIVAAWKDKIDKDGPPSAAAKSEEGGLLEKCLQCVATLAYATQSIDQIADGIHCEACGAYGCNCNYCVSPRDGCCYACNMQFGVDMPLSDNTLATLEAGSKQLFDALVSAAEDCRDADAEEDAEEEAEGAMKALGALTAALNDKDTLKKLQDALHVPRSNGSEVNKASKEGTVSDTKKTEETTIEKADGALLLKGINDLNKTIGDLHTLIKADHEKIEAHDGDITKLAEGFGALATNLSKTLAFVTDVKVEDPGDLDAVMKAIADKPAPGKPAIRTVKKTDDSTMDDAKVEKSARHPFDVEPLRFGT